MPGEAICKWPILWSGSGYLLIKCSGLSYDQRLWIKYILCSGSDIWEIELSVLCVSDKMKH